MKSNVVKKSCVILCAALLFGNVVCDISVNAKTSDSVSGRCGDTFVNGHSQISRKEASAYTTQSGHTGTVKADCTCEYRDVSEGKTKQKKNTKTGVYTVNVDFSVKEEDYMKTLTTKHSMVISSYTWGPSANTTTKVTYNN